MRLRQVGSSHWLLQRACVEPLTVAELIDRVGERWGILLEHETARQAVHDLAGCGYLRRSNPDETAPRPARYVLTAAGEAELERLWARAAA